MNKYILLLVGLLLFTGCGVGYNQKINDQRIEQKKKCDEAGMGAYISGGGYLYCSVK
jgi:hypothetical protein